MDISQILKNTLSPEHSIREAATQSLNKIENENLPMYCMLLSQELANEQSAESIRISAGLALKNVLKSKDMSKRAVLQQKWISSDPNSKQQVKNAVRICSFKAFFTLGSANPKAATVAAQVVESIAFVELPRKEWPDLMNNLLANMTNRASSVGLKKATLEAIGFICEEMDFDVLSEHSNGILTAVVQGALKDEPAPVRQAAVKALYNSLEFVEVNFKNEQERNYIMQTVIDAACTSEIEVSASAFECLVKIMQCYYHFMLQYMNAGLFEFTVRGMKHTDPRISLQAVEFWSTVCEKENELNFHGEDNFSFASTALPYIVPVLLDLIIKQTEDDDDEEWNIAMASATCLGLLASCVEDDIILKDQHVIQFVQKNVVSPEWKLREAAVMAFGSILDGPTTESMKNYLIQATPVFFNLSRDTSVAVRDTTVWLLGRICELHYEVYANNVINEMIMILLERLGDEPRVAANSAWALMNLADKVGFHEVEEYAATNLLSMSFERIIHVLIQAADRTDGNESNLRTAAYESMSVLVTVAAVDVFPLVKQLAEVIIDRLNKTVIMEDTAVGIDDRMQLLELQSSLASVAHKAVSRLKQEITLPVSDLLMRALLTLLEKNISKSSPIIEDLLLVVGSVANGIEGDFSRYSESFIPFLYQCLAKMDDVQLCTAAIGLVGDMCRALGRNVHRYTDSFLNILFTIIQDANADRNLRHHVISSFGDIAMAIEELFAPYMVPVMSILQQAGDVVVDEEDDEELDFILTLQEAVLEAYANIIQGVRAKFNMNEMVRFIPQMFVLINKVFNREDNPEVVIKGAVGLLGDIVDAIGSGSSPFFAEADWILPYIKKLMADRDLSENTKMIVSWAYSEVDKIRRR